MLQSSLPDYASDEMRPQALLAAKGLSARLGEAPDGHLLFHDVSLEVRAGEVIDLVGPSGSGKTTLLSTLARLQPYGSGSLVFRGRQACDMTPQEWRCHVSLLPQKAAFIEGTVRDNLVLAYGFSVRKDVALPSDERIIKALADVGLDDIELDHDITQLSVGQAARIALVRTLLTEPEILLLDEVDAALDARSVERIGALISDYVSHGERGCIRIRHREADAHTSRRLVFEDGILTQEEVRP